MTIYNIEIDYTTGHSLHTERLKELLDVVTTDLVKAKENLKRIKDHYALQEVDRGYYLKLLVDGGEHTISPFWIGYFETLHGAKVIIEDDSDMAFTL